MSKKLSREIVLGVGGGISAYKSCELLRRLQDEGFLINVIPTRSSLNFVGAATWEALSGRPVASDLWNRVHEVPHIDLAKRARAIVIAPTTADLLARLASGRADDLLTNVVLASTAPIILVPAMHSEMWQNSATVTNVATLRKRGYLVIEPETGRMTGEDVGIGRYPAISSIIDQINEFLEHRSDFRGKNVLITAGGTREAIDGVRYIGNSSSGKQGYAIAYEAALRGAKVTLISANVALPDIDGVRILHVESTEQMQDALNREFPDSELLFMAAAIADARPRQRQHGKIDKSQLTTIELIPNPDLLSSLGATKRSNQVIVAFAAQGDIHDSDQIAKAEAKLRAKNADLLYFNDVIGNPIFGSDETSGLILQLIGAPIEVGRIGKMTLASKLLDLAHDKLSLAND